MQQLKEKILLIKIKLQNDPEAFGEVYDLYNEKIYRFIFLKVSSREEAEDLTSETFLKAWQYLNSVRKVDNLKALLYKIARNSVIDYYRKKATREFIAEEESLKKIEDQRDIRKELILNSDLAAVQNHLRQLKDEYREVIIWRFIEEMSIGEIAKILDKSRGAVRVLIHRALRALRNIIDNKEQEENNF